VDAAALPAGGATRARSGAGLAEAERLHWRRRATPARLRRDERRWTLWTGWVLVAFTVPSATLVVLEPLASPLALIWSAHGWAVCRMQSGRGARAVVAIGSERSAIRTRGGTNGAERTALGLLGDLVDHRQRALLLGSGLVLHRGALGAWLLGEQGALLLRPGGRRVDCFCVRVAEADDLPAGDRVAHLLLAVREDETGFATVANLNFSGATWRVRRRIPPRQRPALDEARAEARGQQG
jgi:hypothetical protein